MALISQLRSLAAASFSTASRASIAVAALAAGLASATLSAPLGAQTPVPMTRYTVSGTTYTAIGGNAITTVAGGAATSTGSAATPVACTTGSAFQSVDTYGNGCPGANVNFGTDLRGGIAADGAGNIYIADTNNSMIRKYDPKTGLVTRVAGKGTVCGAAGGQQDSSGDGCPALQTGFAANPRGLNVDPWGNILVAGYGTGMVHVICQAASPLCPGTTGRKQVGYMYRVAGCVGTALGNATSAPTGNTILNTWAGTEGDNTVASPYNNLSGDVTAWGAGAVGNGSCPGTNTNSTVAALNQPRGVGADIYGNVFIGETGTTGAGLRYRVVLGPQTSTFFTGNNPLWAIVNGASYTSTAGAGTYTAHEGYIYTILGGFTGTPSAKGNACGATAYTAEDSIGDGCPFTYSQANGGVQGVTSDTTGNVYFTDTVNSALRVLYVGGANNPIAPAIVANSFSSVTTPVAGNVYLLAGKGTVTPSFAPTLGNTLTLSNGIYKVQVGPGGNLYLGDTNAGSAVQFYDISTGYLRTLFKTGSNCAAHFTGSSIGDGCPASQATYSGANGFGVAVDTLGNVYIGDNETGTIAPANGSLIRKIEASSLLPTTLGSTRADASANTQTFSFRGPVNTASMTATALDAPSDIVPGTITCASPNPDLTADCSVSVAFNPTQSGTRTMHLAVKALDASSNTLGSYVLGISGPGVGSGLVTDVASPTTGTVTGITPGAIALDNAGNVLVADTATSKLKKINVLTSASSSLGPIPANVATVSVAPGGNVLMTSTGSATVALASLNLDGTYTFTNPSNPLIAQPQAAAFDLGGNSYIYDKTTNSIFLVPADNFNSVEPTSVIATGFSNVVGMAFDGSGNLFVADRGLPGVYKIAISANAITTTLYAAGSGSPTVTVAGLIPSAIAADPAGNVYVQDVFSKSTLMIPVSQTGPSTTTVFSGTSLPTGIAVEGNGIVYVADSANNNITRVNRAAAQYNFGTSTSAVFSGIVSNVGNIAATGYFATGLDTADFPITSVSPGNCFNTTAITPGYACSLTSQFTPTSGTGAVSSVLAYTVNTSTSGSLSLLGTKTGAVVTTNTTIGSASPVNPIYAASGTEVSFPVTVTASDSSTPSGSINVSVDSGTNVPYTLVGGTVTVALSGLSAGSHTIVAAYPSQGGLTGSTSSTTNFSIAQATTSTTWTPGATTQQFSAAVGNSVLNAVAKSGSTVIPGYYLYTATPSGGSPSTIHAASYLAIGTYSLAVTFVPLDTTDYTGSSASVGTYTVTKASTTAPIGITQTLVAADGTGNFSDVQSAVNAVGATGGNIYIKPGTYTGDITVVQPNVSIRGLGGNPNNVVLTHESGSFSVNPNSVYNYTGEFTTNYSNGHQLPAGSSLFQGDEGSATLVVARGVNTAFSSATLTPNNFYGEGFTLNNTYDTDTTTSTTTYVNGGVCTANAGPARTYNDLFNSGIQCASQALAIWTTSDLSVFNNVYMGSLQDTIYAGSQGPPVPARQYWFRGKVTGVVDYIFGDAAVVWDYTSFYSPFRTSVTIEAQNKANLSGGASDYLSGYILNSNVITSEKPGMTFLYFGRPYGKYSTTVILNSAVDQLNPLGWTEFGGGLTNLPTSTYGEFNTSTFTDPATGAADPNGVIYLGSGGNSGTGVVGARETVSQNPGTALANNSVKTTVSAAQATLYYPTAFLSGTVTNSSSGVTNWNPTAALATYANGFVPSGTSSTVTAGSPVTILVRPQTPGLGAITNGVYTIPTGSYTITDTVGGNPTVIASGTLDAAGEAYLITSTLSIGTHNLTWTYSGDANFNGSSTSTPYVVTVNAAATTTTLSATANPIIYGQSASINATVSSASGTPSGTVTLTIDGAGTQQATLSAGVASFTVTGLTAGTHSFAAAYTASGNYAASSTASNLSLTVNKASVTVTGSCANQIFDALPSCSAVVGALQFSDTVGTVFTGTPTAIPSGPRTAPVGTYTANPSYTLSTFGAANYTVNAVASNFNVTGGAPQSILFPPLPNFTAGSYQLTARTTSGLPVAYTVTGGTGIASVSGTTLTISGTGAVTVQASTPADPTGDYATATPVSVSFTAQ